MNKQKKERLLKDREREDDIFGFTQDMDNLYKITGRTWLWRLRDNNDPWLHNHVKKYLKQKFSPKRFKKLDNL